MTRTGGIRLLLHALAEGPDEMAPLISSAFLYIVDHPRTRAYLHLGTDLEVKQFVFDGLFLLKSNQMALSGVTDAYGKGTEHAEKMRGTTKLIVSMLRTWSGTYTRACHAAKVIELCRFNVFLYERQTCSTYSGGRSSDTFITD